MGDFVWAGMDYLGEVGVGSWELDDATNRKWKKLSPPDTLSAAPFSADKVSGKSDNLSSYTCHKDGSLVIN